MAFDALGILRGLYGGAMVSMDENDVVPVSKTADTHGNAVVEINKTGAKGLAAVMILTGGTVAEMAANYDDEAVVTIEASDYISERNWETVATFPTIHNHIAELTITATTAFAAADVGQAMTQETTADTGQLLWYDPALETIGGVGKVLIEMDDAGDIFNEVAGKTMNSAGTGRATKTYGAGTTIFKNMVPGIYIRRFTTNKKYVRCNCTNVEDSMGGCWILLTDGAFVTL